MFLVVLAFPAAVFVARYNVRTMNTAAVESGGSTVAFPRNDKLCICISVPFKERVLMSVAVPTVGVLIGRRGGQRRFNATVMIEDSRPRLLVNGKPVDEGKGWRRTLDARRRTTHR